MTLCPPARAGSPRRLAGLLAAALVLQAPLAAGAQFTPVGQTPGAAYLPARFGSPSLDASSAPVQPKERFDLLEAELGPDVSPQRPIEPLRPDNQVDVTVSPEPSTFALLAGAGLVVGAVARRRARRA
jgi:hypothetical protein